MVQQHDATARHFDLRLEHRGVLASWAVPRGPSLDPAERRLAVRVADHGLEAGRFEGVHPGAARGTGAVIIWDRGAWHAPGGCAEFGRGLEEGHVAFVLEGEKLRGRFALTRTAAAPREQWILVKARDHRARRGSDVVRDSPRSAVSGRTLDEVAAGV